MSRIEKFAQVVHLAVALTLAGCACGSRPASHTGYAGYAPGVPFSAGSQPSFGPLPEGVTASYPSFEGDAFSAVLTVRPQESLEPEAALREIAPVLRALGFTRPLEELGSPDEPLRLPPPDLAGLAEEVCGEGSLRQDPAARETCAAMHYGQAAEKAEEAVRNAYGTSFAELRADFETAVLHYSFRQLAGGVPIEGAGVIASRQEGKSLSTVHGTLFNRYVVTNRMGKEAAALLDAGRRVFERRLGKGRLPEVAGKEPRLVALPYGSGRLDGEAVPALRYAWRVLLAAPEGGESWMAWIDAETGALLDLVPQFDGVSVQGERWRRDPGLPAESRTFEVNAATGGSLTLRLDGVFQRVDRRGDGVFGVDEVAVSGSSFDVSPVNNEAAAVCASGGNAAFRQVHAYSHLYSFRKMILDAGIFPSFPVRPVRIWVDHSDPASMAFYDYDPAVGDENSILRFPEGSGFGSGCPGAVNKRLNGAQDATILAHEMSHLSVKRLQERRPADWCGSSSCQMPNTRGRLLFHDFADALAAAYTSTNCFSGWSDKNWGGVDQTRYCIGATSETWGMPRLADVTRDRFPEHRNPSTPSAEQPYADGQIAAAALWRVRQGLRSKEGATGTVTHWARLQQALWNYSFLSPTCASACDRDVYRYLQNLETRMADRWVSSAVQHTVNKVLIGWAETGIFLVPLACLDGSTATSIPSACPSGEGGGDAVIQVLDRDPADDPVVDGVTHPEWDYLERGGGLPPRFRIWTGPRFRFNSLGRAVVGTTFPCHSRYQVEAASDAGFTSNLWNSGVRAVPAVPGCYAELDLPDTAWSSLRGTGGEALIYYRVRTWNASNGNERISTSPGAGAFTVPPPFVVVNDAGRP